MVHLLNFVWPNIFETSPHVINAVFEAIEVCTQLRFGFSTAGLSHEIEEDEICPAWTEVFCSPCPFLE